MMLRLNLEWNDLITGKEIVLFDETESWPDIFPRLRGAIDQNRKRKGRFLLLSSVSPSLMSSVSESLAGRLSLIELTPFLLSELTEQGPRERHWLCGGYPDSGVLKSGYYLQWETDYLAILSQRDLPTWGLPSKPQTAIYRHSLNKLGTRHCRTQRCTRNNRRYKKQRLSLLHIKAYPGECGPGSFAAYICFGYAFRTCSNQITDHLQAIRGKQMLPPLCQDQFNAFAYTTGQYKRLR